MTVGLEPTTFGETVRRSTLLNYATVLVAGARFELASTAYEAAKEPLLHPAI